MKVNFAYRARNAFEREPSEREGPNFSKVSSVTSEITRSYRVLRVARDYLDLPQVDPESEICNFQFTVSSVRKFMEVRKCNVGAMFVFPVHLYRLIH